ncbi:mitochondrial amino-acid acetyltransferase [Gymnopilus junonius]|uniref:Amino-acid acetyltransferase, mitochondrial n=1 Tax=Gymnopilus junonius TaxID=109634 RepID=A0A9P5P2B2_GYMJU|nr:mitochondrial amino-acid acetyltransferase [Gymnopilus junonius]
MIPHSPSSFSRVLRSQRSDTFKAFYATLRGTRKPPPEPADDAPPAENDFILSILRTNPSLRDTRSYLASFGLRSHSQPSSSIEKKVQQSAPLIDFSTQPSKLLPVVQAQPKPSPVVASILNPVYRRTALVKIQGPFTDNQLDSICRGLVYLEKLGLVSVIVVENDDSRRGEQDERTAIIDETMRIVTNLEKQGSKARPVVGAVVRLGPKPGDDALSDPTFEPPEAHTLPSDLIPIRSALSSGEIPVIAPFALDSFCRSVRVDANDVIASLAGGMAEASSVGKHTGAGAEDGQVKFSDEVDLTPLRLMIIDRNGGVPSYARSGFPHLLINLDSEYQHIHDTFDPKWSQSNPSSLSNLALARTCLQYMPATSSAIMVSHKSPSSLIGNLITNKPAVSSSLPHALLQGNRKLTAHTPTLLRRGLPIQVLRSVDDIDRIKMTTLLEQSFKRNLDQDAFYSRLSKVLDFVIIAGDYAGAAIVTEEPATNGSGTISYLDKFAVLPSNQGDGTVDFLWVALHDESYGLGHPFSANPNGGKGGVGEGRDLVWRSRSDNPVNKWYFERSSGHLRMGNWVLFWCDAEKRLRIEEGRRGSAGLSYVEDWEEGRLSDWGNTVLEIPSSWI